MVFDFCGLLRPSREEIDIDPVDSDFLSFCGIKRRRGITKIWQLDPSNDTFTLPNHLEAMLADYTLVMTPTEITAAPAPVGMVLQLLLAETKRRVQTNLAGQSGALTVSKRPYWGYDQVISLEDTGRARGNVLECELAYALWYGDPRSLETNCVIIQSKRPITSTDGISTQYLPVLAAMSMIQRNRKTPSKTNADVFGIFTDGFVWICFHLNKRCKYSSCVLQWNEGQQRSIVGLVSRIIRDAATIDLLCDDTAIESMHIRSTWDRSQLNSSESEGYVNDATDSELSASFRSSNMDWLNDLENRVEQIIERGKNIKDILDVKEAFKIARTESRKQLHQQQATEKQERKEQQEREKQEKEERQERGRQQKKEKQLPTKAVTDIAAVDLWDTFGLKRETARTQIWTLAVSERRGVSNHLREMLSDWDEAFRGADQNEQVIRGRLNSIVVAILAAKRREEYGQHGAGKGFNKRTSTETLVQYKSLRWTLERAFTFRWKIRGKLTKIRGRMDFALWYGNREDLETNMVMVEAKRLHGASQGVPQAIIYMAILHKARKQAGRTNSPIYGIATDSWDWYFLHLDPISGIVSTHFVNWHTDPIEIISLIHKIIDQAACLTPAPSRSLSRQPTVEESSDMDWVRETD